MTMNTLSDPAPLPSDGASPFDWTTLVKRLVIWGLFFLVLYLIRDFIFVVFMTFVISYLALNIVGFCLRWLSPGVERTWLRRLLTLGVFVLGPILIITIGIIVLPPLIAQGQRLAGWLIHVTPEAEVSRLLEQYVGPAEFRRQFGGPNDPRYKAGLEEFRKTGERHIADYLEFPKFEAWVEGGFEKQFDENERAHVRSVFLSEGTTSKDFRGWFLTHKVPELRKEAEAKTAETKKPLPLTDPLLRMAVTASPEELLEQARREPNLLATLQSEWINDAEVEAITLAKNSANREEKFHTYYETMRTESPQSFPYTYAQYTELRQARSQGRVAFGDAVEKLFPERVTNKESQVKSDFEAAQTHEAFKTWWSTSSPAQFIRSKIGSDLSLSTAATSRIERTLTSLLNVPVDLSTALLLSFLICIDFPRVKRACQGLRDTWLKDVYDEMAPALSRLGQLVGRAMQAQGLIALCNSIVIFCALMILGVEHAVLLSAAMFVLCLVPTIGTIFAWILIVAVALVQPGGGVGLAVKVTGAVILVVILEVFVFSPRILGSIMELHPVLIIAVLPLAQYFFGIWGLILATPVAVFVINVIIFGGKDDHSPPAPTT